MGTWRDGLALTALAEVLGLISAAPGVCVCVCVRVKPPLIFYIGLSSFFGLFGPLPPGLVLGINSFWPVMIFEH